MTQKAQEQITNKTIPGYRHIIRYCCVWFVNLYHLQNTLHNFEIVHAPVANFWPEPYPNHNADPNPNL